MASAAVINALMVLLKKGAVGSSKARVLDEVVPSNEQVPQSLQKTIENVQAKAAAKERNPNLPIHKEGPGPAPYDSFTPEGAQGFADPRFSLDELIAKEARELELGPTISKRRKQELKQSKNVEDKKELYKATTGQQGKQDGRPYSVEDPAGEKMTLDRILESEVDESLASRANEAGRVSNQSQSVQNLRNKSQLENLGRSTEEQELLDEAVRIRGAAKRSTNADIDQLGPTRLRKKIGVTAKNFGNKKELNADIQDMYSRLDEMFPGFKKGTPNSKFFSELDAKGNVIPGAKLRGGKDASMASKLNDTKKELANLSQRAREEDDPEMLMILKRKLDKIDNEYFSTKSTQETRQLGNTINPESNVQSLRDIDANPEEKLFDFVAPNRTDAGVEFRQGPTRQKTEQALGPKMSPLLEQLKRNRTGFNPKNLGGTTMTPEEALRRQGNR